MARSLRTSVKQPKLDAFSTERLGKLWRIRRPNTVAFIEVMFDVLSPGIDISLYGGWIRTVGGRGYLTV